MMQATRPFGFAQSRLCRYSVTFGATGAGRSVLTNPLLRGVSEMHRLKAANHTLVTSSFTGSEAATEWVAPLQFHPNRHNRFSFHGYCHFIFRRSRNSVYGLKELESSAQFNSTPQPALPSALRPLRTRSWSGARPRSRLRCSAQETVPRIVRVNVESGDRVTRIIASWDGTLARACARAWNIECGNGAFRSA